jgi:hypothetical protein
MQRVSRSEIVQGDIPQQPRATAPSRAVPWEWFGEAKAANHVIISFTPVRIAADGVEWA